MADYQGLDQDAAPPCPTSDIEGRYNPSYGIDSDYPPQEEPGHTSQGQPRYSPQYPPQDSQSGYPAQYHDKEGYPTINQLGYPPQYTLQDSQPGYPPQYPSTVYNQQPMPGGIQSSHNFTVMQSGGPMVTEAVFPSDYCCLAWFSCLCCPVIGLFAVLYSHNTKKATTNGDLVTANHYSQMAIKYATFAIVAGILVTIINMFGYMFRYESGP